MSLSIGEVTSAVPDYTEKAIPFFIAAILVEVAIGAVKGSRPFHNRSYYDLADSLNSLCMGLFDVFSMILIPNVDLFFYLIVWNNYRCNPALLHVILFMHEWIWSPSVMWHWLGAFLLIDMAYYWFHRFAHEVNIVWASHVNLSTALRQSGMQRLFHWGFYLPFALFIPPKMFLVMKQFTILYQFWIHTEHIGTLGPIEWIMNTPSHHRLIIWDRMFGTFEPEDGTIAYGLVHNLDTWNPVVSQFHHFAALARSVSIASSFRERLGLIFMGPGWRVGHPRLGVYEEIPALSDPKLIPAPYSSARSNALGSCMATWFITNNAQNAYCTVHFALVLVGSVFLLEAHKELTRLVVVAIIVLLVGSMFSIGVLLDCMPVANFVESVRLLLVLSATNIQRSVSLPLPWLNGCLVASLLVQLYWLRTNRKAVQRKTK